MSSNPTSQRTASEAVFLYLEDGMTTEVTRAEFELLSNNHEQLQRLHIETRERVAKQEAVSHRLEDDVREIGRKVDTLTNTMQNLKDGIDRQFDRLNSGRAKLVLGATSAAGGITAAVYWLLTNVPALVAFLHHISGAH